MGYFIDIRVAVVIMYDHIADSTFLL